VNQEASVDQEAGDGIGTCSGLPHCSQESVILVLI